MNTLKEHLNTAINEVDEDEIVDINNYKPIDLRNTMYDYTQWLDYCAEHNTLDSKGLDKWNKIFTDQLDEFKSSVEEGDKIFQTQKDNKTKYEFMLYKDEFNEEFEQYIKAYSKAVKASKAKLSQKVEELSYSVFTMQSTISDLSEYLGKIKIKTNW